VISFRILVAAALFVLTAGTPSFARTLQGRVKRTFRQELSAALVTPGVFMTIRTMTTILTPRVRNVLLA
jgi:hypothetical protein